MSRLYVESMERGKRRGGVTNLAYTDNKALELEVIIGVCCICVVCVCM